MEQIIKDNGKSKWVFVTGIPDLEGKDKSLISLTCKLRSEEWVRVNVRLEERKREERREKAFQKRSNGLKVLNPKKCWSIEGVVRAE